MTGVQYISPEFTLSLTQARLSIALNSGAKFRTHPMAMKISIDASRRNSPVVRNRRAWFTAHYQTGRLYFGQHARQTTEEQSRGKWLGKECFAW